MSFLVSQPDFGEQALEIAETLVRSNAVGVVVIDSVAALVPKAELEGDMGASLPWPPGKADVTGALESFTATIHKSDCIMIFINQESLSDTKSASCSNAKFLEKPPPVETP